MRGTRSRPLPQVSSWPTNPETVLKQCARHARVYLWVLKGNARARRFYEIAGFRADGAKEPYAVDGLPVPEARYVKDRDLTSD